MRSHVCLGPALLLAGLSLHSSARAQGPVLDGYVTAVTSQGFDVMGVHVLLTSHTRLEHRDAGAPVLVAQLDRPFLGEPIAVWGHMERDRRSLTATRVETRAISPATVSGTAVVQSVSASAEGERVFEADGYRLHLVPVTKLHFADPLQSLDDLRPDTWVAYRGVQGKDGQVELSEVTLAKNVPTKAEAAQRAKPPLDPSAVGENERQPAAEVALLGYNSKRIPAANDAPAQARIERIGDSLVPKYQRELPPDEPTRIPFRFQLVDEKNLLEILPSANGVILVPNVVEKRLTDDSQLAAVLAEAIAVELEKQDFRIWGVLPLFTAASVAKYAAECMIPGGSIVALSKADDIVTRALEQSTRVSLSLLHDAGYDLAQAPIAFRLLATRTPKPLDETPLLTKVVDLYEELGTTWHPAPPGASQTPTSTAPPTGAPRPGSRSR